MSIHRIFFSFALFFFSAIIFVPQHAGALEERSSLVVTVAVAANALRPVQEIAEAYTESSGVKVRIVHGSTGKLYAQIRQGAPFDIFLAADQRRPALLVKEGVRKKEASFTYARGRLVLWTLDKDIDLSLTALADKRVKKISIANPVTAPYGRAAMEVLAERKLLPDVEAKLVYGESVSQAFSYARTGNAEVAITSLSTIKGQSGRYKLIDEALYSEIIQDGVVLTFSNEVLGFRDFLFSKRAKEIFADYGYRTNGNR